MKKMFFAALCALGAFAASAQDPYKVQYPMSADDEGAMVYIINFDNGQNVDSTLVEDGVALFKGTVDEPFAARIMYDGKRGPRFILESGSIAFNERGLAYGSPLNDKWNEIAKAASELGARIEATTDTTARHALINQYGDMLEQTMKDNISNPIGLTLFMEQAYDMTPAQVEEYVAKEPSLAKSQRVSKLIAMNRKKATTGVGAKYTDFDIKGQKLSDFVGKDGKYLLVDFWASWCGPCRREIPGIKELLQENSDKLSVLGVAVWDKPEDTLRAVKELGITWPVILDAQTIPTDIYGISGIPCIMLIAPDGTIVSRDKQGPALKADVLKAIGKK